MSPADRSRTSFQALVDALGYVDAVRFIKQFDQGHGDYTKDRSQWLDHLTLDEILSPEA